MRRLLAATLTALLAACGEGGKTVAPAPGPEAAATSPIEIVRTEGRPAPGESDMRTLEPFTGDLDAMIDRGVIRVLVAESRTHFYTDKQLHRGRTVDAVDAFQRFVHERIAPRTISVQLIPASESTLVSDLIAGQGDIAANMLRTFERDDQVAFAKPLRSGIRELIVTGPGVKPLVSLEDIGGRAIHVRRHSDHHASLLRLNEQLRKIDRPQAEIVLAPEDVTDEQLLDLVNTGRIPATIVDDFIYDGQRPRLEKTTANRDVAVSQDGEIAWVTRKESTQLLALINEFFATHRLSF